MKGKTLIELKDLEGNIVSTHEDTNLITNAFKDYINILAYGAVPCSNLDTERNSFNLISQAYKGLMDVGFERIGIKVFSELQEENPTKYFNPNTPLTYGTQSTVLKDGKGIYNTLSSKKLTNEEGAVIGYRFVWDFPTNVGNGVIKSVSLTPLNNIPAEESAYLNHFISSANSRSANANTFNFSMQGRNLITRKRDGRQIQVINGNVVKIDKESVIPTIDYTSWSITEDNYDIFTIERYVDLFKVIDMDTYYLTIGKNTSTSKYELLKLNYTTLEVEETKVLEDLDMSTYTDFGVVGTKGSLDDIKYVIYHIASRSGVTVSTSSTKSYNMENKEVQNVGASIGSSSGNALTELSIIEGAKGELVTRLTIMRSTSYLAIKLFRYKDGQFTTTETVDNITNAYQGTTATFGTHTYFGLSPICMLQTHYSGYYYVVLGYDWNTLFTINNLETPITKTDANTMKITYELTWGE